MKNESKSYVLRYFFSIIAVLLFLILWVLELWLVINICFKRSLIENEFVSQVFQVIFTQIVSSINWKMAFRRQKWIKSDSQSVLNQWRYDSIEYIAIDHKTWIKINLDQIRFKIIVDHEVKSKKLKVVSFPFMIQIEITGLYDINHNRFHFLDDIFKGVTLISKGVIEVSLKLGVG